jgi:FeS assembly protein IscX
MPKLAWSDTDEIAFQLSEKHPDIDPLTVRFVDLHKYVTSLPDFAGNPADSNERVLEAIQMAWLEYHKERD